MDENVNMNEEERITDQAKAWLQENLRVIVSFFIVAAIALVLLGEEFHGEAHARHLCSGDGQLARILGAAGQHDREHEDERGDIPEGAGRHGGRKRGRTAPVNAFRPLLIQHLINDRAVVGGERLLQILGRRVELEIPVSSNIRSLGLRPSAFVDVGSVFMIEKPNLVDIQAVCTPINENDDTIYIPPASSCPATGYVRQNGFKEYFQGDSPSPRLSIGVGVNWVSPFGPLRIDVAKAILKQEGDQTKFFSFNVGTQF